MDESFFSEVIADVLLPWCCVTMVVLTDEQLLNKPPLTFSFCFIITSVRCFCSCKVRFKFSALFIPTSVFCLLLFKLLLSFLTFIPEQQHHWRRQGHLLQVQRHLLSKTESLRGPYGWKPSGSVQEPRQLHLYESSSRGSVPLRRHWLFCSPFVADGAVTLQQSTEGSWGLLDFGALVPQRGKKINYFSKTVCFQCRVQKKRFTEASDAE